ncbi:MAG: lysylphosphatidylglycerol synthase transmembrane domain-containing protein [Deltaproteobacteria bacterium]|nr:lysylphosphatidylglycerol synthase transmembrane domain-containing protein [Deltaproteobacteria bacterium]
MSQTQDINEHAVGKKLPAELPLVTGSGPGSFKLVRSVLIFAVSGIILYAAATFGSDFKTVLGALLEFPMDRLGIVVGLVFVGWLLRGWRFYYYLRQSGEKVPLVYSMEAFLAGFALTGTPGKVGEAVKGVFLKEDYGVSMTRVVGILLVERLMDLWGVLFLGSFSLLLFEGWSTLFLLCAVVVVGGGIFICMERLYRPVLERLSKISFLSWVCTRLLAMLLTGKDLMTPKIFFIGLLVSTVAWGMESVSLFLITSGFKLQASFLQANFVYCFSTVVGALSMLPGGIVGTEAGMVGLLSFVGIPYSRSLPAVILIRLCTLWMAVLVGAGFMTYLLARPRIRTSVGKSSDNS